MAGIADDASGYDVFYGDNVDFSGQFPPAATIVTNGQLLIGSTAGRHIQVGALTSPLGSITIGYSNPNITIDSTGGQPTTKIGVDVATGAGTNPTLPTAAGLITFTGGQYAAGTFGTRVLTIVGDAANEVRVEAQISSAKAATTLTANGLSHFDSTSFAVDANGFVTLSGGGFKWNDISGAFSPLKDNGYFVTGTATGTLPASPSQGDTIKFFVDHASQVLTITAAGTQIIRLGTLVSSAGGTAVSTAQGDSIELTYRASDTCWCSIAGFTGTWIMA